MPSSRFRTSCRSGAGLRSLSRPVFQPRCPATTAANLYDVTTLGFSDLTVFAGDGPYFETSGSGSSFSVTPQSDATGVLLSGGKLALAMFSPTNPADPSSYFAVSASADSISFPGLDFGSGGFKGRGYRIEVNGGSDGTAGRNQSAINFTTMAGGKFSVPVGNGTVDFDYTSRLQRVAIERATIVD